MMYLRLQLNKTVGGVVAQIQEPSENTGGAAPYGNPLGGLHQKIYCPLKEK